MWVVWLLLLLRPAGAALDLEEDEPHDIAFYGLQETLSCGPDALCPPGWCARARIDALW